MMAKPRCGFPDITHNNYGYYSTRSRWRYNTVNYAYDNYGKHSCSKAFCFQAYTKNPLTWYGLKKVKC